MSGYYLLKRGEFAYNKSYSVGYDYGTIKRLNKYDEGCLSTLYICFAIKSNAIDSNYLECFFDSLVWYKDMANVCTEGARNHGLLNVDIEEFFNIKVVYPADIEEQKKTAKILNNLDEKIKAEKTNVEKLKALKSSMLTKMFPKEGESVPELRFKGFTEPWEQRRLGDLMKKGGSGGTPTSSNSDYYNGSIPFLSITDITNSNGFIYDTDKHITEAGLNASSAWIVPKEAISLAMYASVGKVAILKENIATSQAFYNMIFEDNIIRDYIFQFLKKMEINSEWLPLISTGTQANLNAEKVKNLMINIPKEKKEMKQLSECLFNLDNLITFHQRKYEKLLDVKKAFLEKMIGGDN